MPDRYMHYVSRRMSLHMYLVLAAKINGALVASPQIDISDSEGGVKIHPYFIAVLHVVLLGQILCGLVV